MLKQLINLFIKKNGRSPNAIEMLQLKFKAAQQSGKGQVIEFPKDKITDWTKARSRPPETEIINGIQTTRGLGDLFGKQLEKAIKKTKATPKVVERSMPADDYYNFKEEWFGRIIANTDDDINTFLKKGINQADERFVTLSKDQRKDFLDMVEYRLKHGNEKFMNDSEMFFGYKKNGRKPHKYGGLAGMLGERTGYKTGLKVYPQASVRIGEADIPNLPPEIIPKTKDTTYGGTIIGEKDNLYGGIEGLKIKNKIDFVLDNQTLFKDTTDDEIINFILGKKGKYGDIRLKTDKDLENAQISWNWKFADGGLAPLLGEPTYQDEDHRVPYNEGGSISNVLPLDFDDIDPEEMIHIIKLLQTGEIPEFADGGRIGFKLGGIDKARRLFLQAMGAGAAGIGAAKTGLFGLLKGSKSTAVKNLTQIPIKDAKGMPPWFKPLVNRIIKEGTETTKLPPNKGGAFLDRQIVHSKKLGEGKTVRVYQTLDDQSIRVEYETAENMGGAPQDTIHLEYKAAEEIEPILAQHMDPKNPKGPWLPNKAQKTEPTFEASEPWPQGTTGDYKDITFDGENRVNEVKDLMSDTSTLKQFGTNKALSKEELKIAKQKRKRVNEINNDLGEQDQLLPDPPDYDGYASGGRVPLKGGKTVKGIAELIEQFFPGTTKVGQTSRPMAEKTQLRKAIADFQERQKNIATEEDYASARDILDDPDADYYPVKGTETKSELEAMIKKADADYEAEKKYWKKIFDAEDAAKNKKTIVVNDDVGSAMAEWARKNDPEGYAKIQKFVDDLNQKIELKRAKRQKGRKDHALGGLANMLGE